MRYFQKVLKNGLTVIEVPSSDSESVVVDFFIKTGSRSEQAKENGISHFLEHFLFKGTRKYPSALAIAELIDAIGGEMNAHTSKEYTEYYIKAAFKHLPLIFEVLTDMIQQPLLDPGELEREKGVIIEEINMYKDAPMYEIENVLEQTMWPKEPLGRDIAGSKTTVSKFTREMFLSYITRHYQTANMILGISGKYHKSEFNKLLERYWEHYPKKSFHQWEKVKDRQTKPRLKVAFKETEQAHLSFGFKSFPYGDVRNPAVAVVGAILGGGMSSRLFTEIREKRGLAYYVRAVPNHFQDTGVFVIGAGVKIDKIQEAIQVILKELHKIKNFKVEMRELQKAKEYLKGKTTLALEDNQARLDWFLERAAFFNTIETPEEVFQKIDAVSSQDVQNAAGALFQNHNMTLAVIGPYQNKKQFSHILYV